MAMTIERFAQWSWARDFALHLANPYDSETKAIYLKEAAYYMTLPRSEWPCGILLRMGEHKKHHPGCDTTDPLS